MEPISAEEAKRLILSGYFQDEMMVTELLNLSKNDDVKKLPGNLNAKRLNLNDCKSLKSLPKGLSCNELSIQNSKIIELPEDISVKFRIDLSNCSDLEVLPRNLKVGTLILRNCTSLKCLPEGLRVNFLDITSCNFSEWPEDIVVEFGYLIARNCENITSLPESLNDLTTLDLRNCTSISKIPEDLKISAWIDIAGTKITKLPKILEKTELRWRGVPIKPRIAFNPETITSKEILNEINIESRRVLLERMGYQKFLENANAIVIHEDTDPGGERKLVRIDLHEDEPLVCLSMICPSTRRQYVVRVPPDMKNCHHAASWIAGFDNPKKYNPIIET